MALLKMGQAARRAGAGSTNAIRRALQAAGVPLVELDPGNPAVEEADLDRFLRDHPDWKSGQKPPSSPTPGGKPKRKKPDNRRR